MNAPEHPERPNVAPLPTRPPRAVLLTASPVLADRVRAMDPRIHTTVLHQLPGSHAPRLAPREGLLLLAGDADTRTAASTGIGTITRTLLISDDLDDASVYGRAADSRADEVLFLPDDDVHLAIEIARQLGPAPAATVLPGPGWTPAPTTTEHTPTELTPTDHAPTAPRTPTTGDRGVVGNIAEPPTPAPAGPALPLYVGDHPSQHDPAAHDVTDLWAPTAGTVDRRLVRDPQWPVLALQLQTLDLAGYDVAALLHSATDRLPLLPDDSPCKALASRLRETVAARPDPAYETTPQGRQAPRPQAPPVVRTAPDAPPPAAPVTPPPTPGHPGPRRGR